MGKDRDRDWSRGVRLRVRKTLSRRGGACTDPAWPGTNGGETIQKWYFRDARNLGVPGSLSPCSPPA